MLKLLPFALKSLLRNRRRTILTVLSVTISLFLLAILLSVYALFYHRETAGERASRLITRHKVSLTQVMPQHYGDKIRAVDGVEKVSIMNWFGGTYIDSRPEHMFARFAVEPDKIFDVLSEYKAPPEQMEAFKNDRQAMAVGKTIADRLGFQLGQRIVVKGDIFPINPEFIIRCIFQGPDDNQAFFHLKYLEESLPQGYGDFAGTFAIRMRSPDDAGRISREVDEMFRNSPQPTKTETESAFQLGFINQLGNIKLFLLVIAGAVTFTIMLVSANTVAMSVRERTREIGVMKTLGFTANAVLALVIVEAVALALIGGILGVGLAYVITQAMADMFISFFTGFGMPLWGVPICLAAAVVIGFTSSFAPALIASRTRITEALRHTG